MLLEAESVYAYLQEVMAPICTSCFRAPFREVFIPVFHWKYAGNTFQQGESPKGVLINQPSWSWLTWKAGTIKFVRLFSLPLQVTVVCV